MTMTTSLTVTWSGNPHDPILVRTAPARPGSREQALWIAPEGWTYPPPKPPEVPRKLADVIAFRPPKDSA